MIVTLPQLSLSMEEGKIARWLVADGALVAAGQPILEIETDKAMAEVEAPVAGTLRRIAAEGTVVKVDAPLAEIVEAAAATKESGRVAPETRATQMASPSAAAKSLDSNLDRERNAIDVHSDGNSTQPAQSRKHRASPAARRVARERDIDLSQRMGTGLGGRIMVRDLGKRSHASASAAVGATQAAAHTAPSAQASSMRRAVVAQLEASWRDIPHIHIGGELDGTGLAAAKRSAAAGITVTDLLVLAATRALREVPELNGEIGKPASSIHLALAIATAAGIIAPVIRNADRLSLTEISQERARLVKAAREKTLDRRDLAGGTFTLTNLGAFPVDFFAPIVSGPQLAMLATGRLAERAVVVDGVISARHRIWMNVAIDHRGADGIAGAQFLGALERQMNALAG